MKIRKIIIVVLAAFLLAGGVRALIRKINESKYSGHGFDYMNGYSSTDFTGYHVYDGEKLAVLDHEASLTIDNEEDMPVLDGAEACYPLYSAVAKAVYKNIGTTEKDYLKENPKENGKIVTFTNTVFGYARLAEHKIDIMFGAVPSAAQKEYAREKIEQIETLPIGKEAFVFFTEEDNPVDNLTSEQIRAIYHGDITNWKEVGGKDQKITAFQRPEDSGSQVMMKYFMGDVSLKEPKTYESVSGMGGVIQKVAQYNNEAGALGYTFKYFLTGLNQEEHVKILSVDGVFPDEESIRDGTYPAVVNLVAAKLRSNDDPNVRRMMEFLLSEDGQKLIGMTGYVPLTEPIYETRIENELPETETYRTEDGGFRFVVNKETDSQAYAEYSGERKQAYLAYYGTEMEREELRETWSLAMESGEGWTELLMKKDAEGFTVSGYLTDDAYTGQAPEGMPPAGTRIRLQAE